LQIQHVWHCVKDYLFAAAVRDCAPVGNALVQEAKQCSLQTSVTVTCTYQTPVPSFHFLLWLPLTDEKHAPPHVPAQRARRHHA